MQIDEKLLLEIIRTQESVSLDFVLHLDSKEYPLKNVLISKSSTPVTRPTTRGGVYFSDTLVFKMKGTINDTSILSSLSNSMLGPNAEFKELEITTKTTLQKKLKNVTFYTNLTNSMQSSSYLELNMTIIRTNVQ